MLTIPTSDLPLQTPRRAPWWLMLLLVLAIVACYAQTWTHQFVDFDDLQYIVENPRVATGLSWENIRWAFNIGYAANWHPLTWLSLMTDCHLFGVHAGSLLAVNYLQHAISTLLLLHLLIRITGSVWRSALVAALFALHPQHVESVAWVTERKDTLSTLLGLLAILAYVRYTRAPSIGRYLLVVLGMALSLMAKPMLVTLPGLLLLLDFWPLRRWGPDRSWCALLTCMLEKIPLMGLSLGSAAITMVAQRGAMASPETLPLTGRLGNAGVATVMYLWQMVFPVNLAALYPLRYDRSALLTGSCCLAVIALTAGVLTLALTRERWRVLGVGWLWYLATLLPVIGIVQVGMQAMADRYTYVPQIGVFMMLAWAVPEVWLQESRRRLLATGIASAMLAILAVLTFLQVRTWRNSWTLWSQALAVTHQNFQAANNMGFYAWKQQGKSDVAEQLFRQSIEWSARTRKAQPGRNLGQLYMEMGRWKEASHLMEVVTQLEPQSATAWNDLGICLASLGQSKRALEAFNQAAALSPETATYHRNRGLALAQLQQHAQAIEAFNTALQLAPGDLAARVSLAESLLNLEQMQEAEKQLQLVLKSDARSMDALRLQAEIYLRTNRGEQAISVRKSIVQLDPRNPQSWIELGQTLQQAGQVNEAAEAIRRALGLKPRDAKLWLLQGQMEVHRGQLGPAASAFQRAMELDPKLSEAKSEFQRVQELMRSITATQPAPAPDR